MVFYIVKSTTQIFSMTSRLKKCSYKNNMTGFIIILYDDCSHNNIGANILYIILQLSILSF